MKISLYNLQSDDYTYDNMVVCGGPGIWTIYMFLHCLFAKVDKQIKINDFSYILNNYKYYPFDNKSSPFDMNQKGLNVIEKSLDLYKDITKPNGLIDLTVCSITVSIFIDIDIGELNKNLIYPKIINALYSMKLGSGNISNIYNDISDKPSINKISVIKDESLHDFIKFCKNKKGFICSGVSIPSKSIYDILVSNNVDYKDKKNKKISDNKIIRPMLVGFHSSSGIPVEREGSRNGLPHVFAEPVISIVEWINLEKINPEHLTERYKWCYNVNQDKTEFLIKNTERNI